MASVACAARPSRDEPCVLAALLSAGRGLWPVAGRVGGAGLAWRCPLRREGPPGAGGRRGGAGGGEYWRERRAVFHAGTPPPRWACRRGRRPDDCRRECAISVLRPRAVGRGAVSWGGAVLLQVCIGAAAGADLAQRLPCRVDVLLSDGGAAAVTQSSAASTDMGRVAISAPPPHTGDGRAPTACMQGAAGTAPCVRAEAPPCTGPVLALAVRPPSPREASDGGGWPHISHILMSVWWER
jgi:hypothetical protein